MGGYNGRDEIELASSRRALVGAPPAEADVEVVALVSAVDAEADWKLVYRPEIDGLRFFAVIVRFSISFIQRALPATG